MKIIGRMGIVCLLLFVGSITLSAQNYKSAVGVRLGSPLALSYKVFLNESSAIEVYGFYRKRSFFGYHWSNYGLGATYQIHKDLSNVARGLQWFFGGGGGVSFFSYSDLDYFGNVGGTGLSIHGALGLDYRFDSVPINLSLDWKPTFFLSGYYDGFGARYGALSVRYVLGE